MIDSQYDGRLVVCTFPSPGWGGIVLGVSDDGQRYAVEVLTAGAEGAGAIVMIPAEDVEAYLV